MRGEEHLVLPGSFSRLEIPPRARGRGEIERDEFTGFGNTPACAGKSICELISTVPSRKYPRVRGEETRIDILGRQISEIPPRARGRAAGPFFTAYSTGNTPACAGKSGRHHVVGHVIRKYPRVRGEEAERNRPASIATEIPPRARGRAGS